MRDRIDADQSVIVWGRFSEIRDDVAAEIGSAQQLWLNNRCCQKI